MNPTLQLHIMRFGSEQMFCRFFFKHVPLFCLFYSERDHKEGSDRSAWQGSDIEETPWSASRTPGVSAVPLVYRRSPAFRAAAMPRPGQVSPLTKTGSWTSFNQTSISVNSRNSSVLMCKWYWISLLLFDFWKSSNVDLICQTCQRLEPS